MRSMTEPERKACLERAGYNVFNLDAADVEIDLFTDIPPGVLLGPGAQPVPQDARHPDLDALAAEIYGPAHYVALTKGRSAEVALFAAMADHLRTTVVTHGLFKSTERALERYGARLELAEGHSPAQPTCDIDLGWLEQRLARGGVGMVFLEPNNNGLGGRPLTLENVKGVAELCKRHGALLALDATRLLTNVAALGMPVIETAKRFTEQADLFVMSCAKELLVPMGGLAAVRSYELKKKIFMHGFFDGSLLEPLEANVRLAHGMKYVKQHPEVIVHRVQQTARLQAALTARGVPCLEPSGGHAVYVLLDRLLSPTDPLRPRAIEAFLYQRSGVRSFVWAYPAFGRVMRLAITMSRYSDDELGRAAEALGDLFERTHEIPRLEVAPGEFIFEMKKGYLPAGEAVRSNA